MNSFIHMLLFTVVAAVLFASGDPMVAAAPAGEQVPPVPSKGDDGKDNPSFLDILPGKNDNNVRAKDVVNDIGTQVKSAWSGLYVLLSGVKVPKLTN